MKLIAIAVIFICIVTTSLISYSQNSLPVVEWQKCYGGTSDEFVNYMNTTSDGGYIVCGYTLSNDSLVSGNHGSGDVWIVRINNSGGIVWKKCYGGSDFDVGMFIQQTSDGGFFFTGTTRSNNGDVTGIHGYNSDYWAVKLDANGNIQWTRCLGGTQVEEATCALQSSDGGYLIVGISGSNDGDVTFTYGYGDLWAVKLNASGGIEWQKCYGGTYIEGGRVVAKQSSNGYILACKTLSTDYNAVGNHGGYDIMLLNISSLGNVQWQKCLGGSGHETVSGIDLTSNGDILLCGSSNSTDGDITSANAQTVAVGENFWVIRLNSFGNMIWERSIGGYSIDRAFSIAYAQNGDIFVAGETNSNDFDVSGNNSGSQYGYLWKDIWVLKLSSNGYIVQQKCFGGGLNDADSYIKVTSDGMFAIAASTASNDGDVSGNYSNTHQGGRYYDYWVAKMSLGIPLPNTRFICPLGKTWFISNITGPSYQWQVNDGSGFVNINSNIGSASNFILTNPSTSMYGNQYRCLSNGVFSDTFTIKFLNKWTGMVNSDWEIANNWSCRSLPDLNTDVLIENDTVFLNTNQSCRSLTLKNNARLNISTARNLKIMQ